MRHPLSLCRQGEVDASNGSQGGCTLGVVFKVETSICQCPPNLKRLREESVMYSAQTSTLDARAGNLLMSLLNCVVKAEILIEQWKGQDIEDWRSRGKDACWKFSVRLCPALPCCH